MQQCSPLKLFSPWNEMVLKVTAILNTTQLTRLWKSWKTLSISSRANPETIEGIDQVAGIEQYRCDNDTCTLLTGTNLEKQKASEWRKLKEYYMRSLLFIFCIWIILWIAIFCIILIFFLLSSYNAKSEHQMREQKI